SGTVSVATRCLRAPAVQADSIARAAPSVRLTLRGCMPRPARLPEEFSPPWPGTRRATPAARCAHRGRQRARGRGTTAADVARSRRRVGRVPTGPGVEANPDAFRRMLQGGFADAARPAGEGRRRPPERTGARPDALQDPARASFGPSRGTAA